MSPVVVLNGTFPVVTLVAPPHPEIKRLLQSFTKKADKEMSISQEPVPKVVEKTVVDKSGVSLCINCSLLVLL